MRVHTGWQAAVRACGRTIGSMRRVAALLTAVLRPCFAVLHVSLMVQDSRSGRDRRCGGTDDGWQRGVGRAGVSSGEGGGGEGLKAVKVKLKVVATCGGGYGGGGDGGAWEMGVAMRQWQRWRRHEW